MINYPQMWAEQLAAAALMWVVQHPFVVLGVMLWIVFSIVAVELMIAFNRWRSQRIRKLISKHWREAHKQSRNPLT